MEFAQILRQRADWAQYLTESLLQVTHSRSKPKAKSERHEPITWTELVTSAAKELTTSFWLAFE